MKLNNAIIAQLLLTIAAAAVVLCMVVVPFEPTFVQAQQQRDDEPKTRETPSLRKVVFEALMDAQELGEADQFHEALAVLKRLEKMNDLNSYEAANMYSFYAFIYYKMENYRGAISAYESVLAQPGLPEVMETKSIYALGQLYFTVKDYPKSIELLERWFATAVDPGPEPYVFLSQAYFQQNHYRAAIGPLETAIRIAKEQGKPVKDNWRRLLRVLHYELADVNSNINTDWGALHLAAYQGDRPAVEQLIASGSDVDAKDETDFTALHWAARKGHTSVVEFLINANADINVEGKNSMTALHWAAHQGHTSVVELLITAGANVNGKDAHNRTALYMASSEGHTLVVEALITAGADLESKETYEWTALHMAASQGHVPVVELRIAAGADVNAKDKKGNRPRKIAKKRGHKDIVRLLRKHGAK